MFDATRRYRQGGEIGRSLQCAREVLSLLCLQLLENMNLVISGQSHVKEGQTIPPSQYARTYRVRRVSESKRLYIEP